MNTTVKNWIYLPSQESSVVVASFWSALGLTLGIAVVLVYSFVWPALMLFGAAGALAGLVGLALFVRPVLASKLCRYYRAFVNRTVAAAARQWVVLVVYFLMIVPNRGHGRRFDPGGVAPGESMWKKYEEDAYSSGNGEKTVNLENRGEGSSWREWYRWSVQSGNLWVLGMLPAVVLLDLLGTQTTPERVRTDTYTLY